MKGAVQRFEGVAAAGLAWSGLPHSLYSSPSWLLVAEALAGTPARCTVLTRDGRPRSADVSWESDGGMWVYNDPVALLALGGAELDGHLDAAEMKAIAPLAADVARGAAGLYPARVSVLPSAYRPGMVLGDPNDLDALLDDLEADGTPTTAVMHVDDADRGLSAALRERGYVPLCTAGDCVLTLDPAWSCLEDYAAAAKGRRKRLRRESSAFAASGARIRETNLDALDERHARLHAAHLRRYGHDADERSSLRLLSEIQGRPSGTPFVLEVVEGGDVTGFLVAYVWADLMATSMVGLASDAPCAYFELVVYEPVRRAVERNLSRLHLGPGTYAAKRQRGCEVRPLTSWVRVPPDWTDRVTPLAALLDTGYRRQLGVAPTH